MLGVTGMMILLSAGVQAWLEIAICRNIPFLLHLNRHSRLFGMAFSMGISVFITFLFPATGFIVMTAGLLSCVVTDRYYRLPDTSFGALQGRKAQAQEYVSTNKDRWYRNGVFTLRALRLMFKVVLFPFSIFFRIVDGVRTRSI